MSVHLASTITTGKRADVTTITMLPTGKSLLVTHLYKRDDMFPEFNRKGVDLRGEFVREMQKI